MIEVPAIARSEIDAWPLPEAGLPLRVVNGATKTGVTTVGELRALPAERIAAMPGIGRRSQDVIRFFLSFCGRISSGEVRFTTVDQLLRLLMYPVEHKVLALRYGLDRDAVLPNRWPATLRAVGENQDVTRERARQLIERAKARIQSRLGQACLGRVYSDFHAFLRGKRGAATAREVENHSHPAYMEGTNPCGLLRLLCEYSGTLHCRHGFFASLPPMVFAALETHPLFYFRSHAGPVTLNELLATLHLPGISIPPRTVEHVLRMLLTHMPGIAATVDDRYFVPGSGAPALLRELFNGDREPRHYRALVQEYNALMRPGNRKGTGFILDVLRHSGGFSCASPGTYAPRAFGATPAADTTEGRMPCV